MKDNEEMKMMKEAVQCWAESVALHIASSARGLSKYDAQALRQLFEWPQMLRKSLPIQELIERLVERTSR